MADDEHVTRDEMLKMLEELEKDCNETMVKNHRVCEEACKDACSDVYDPVIARIEGSMQGLQREVQQNQGTVQSHQNTVHQLQVTVQQLQGTVQDLQSGMQRLQWASGLERKIRLREVDRSVTRGFGIHGSGFRVHIVPKPSQLDVTPHASSSASPGESNTHLDHCQNAVTITDSEGQETVFDDNHVVHPPALGSVKHVWDGCALFVDGVVNQPPRRVLMLAHGRTGSGKTYLMANPVDGMIQATLWRIFRLRGQESMLGHGVVIEATSVAIWKNEAFDHENNEVVYKPCDSGSGRWDAMYKATGQRVERTPIPTFNDALAFVNNAYHHRDSRTGAASAGAQWRRSHLVVTFFVVVDRGGNGGRCEGSVHFADMAGNEGPRPDGVDSMEHMHLAADSLTLAMILPCIRNRGFSHTMPGGEPARSNVSAEAWRTRMVRAIQLPLLELEPRVLVFLTIHSHAFTEDTRRTLEEGYQWMGAMPTLPRRPSVTWDEIMS
jgi:hypothetical protein